jgi:hypothetical protein
MLRFNKTCCGPRTIGYFTKRSVVYFHPISIVFDACYLLLPQNKYSIILIEK